MRAAAGIVAVATLVADGRADAQEELRAQCTTGGATVPFCELAVLGLENLAARAGIVSAGGNPVPGTASTFGMRLGPLPRMSLAGTPASPRAAPMAALILVTREMPSSARSDSCSRSSAARKLPSTPAPRTISSSRCTRGSASV